MLLDGCFWISHGRVSSFHYSGEECSWSHPPALEWALLHLLTFLRQTNKTTQKVNNWFQESFMTRCESIGGVLEHHPDQKCSEGALSLRDRSAPPASGASIHSARLTFECETSKKRYRHPPSRKSKSFGWKICGGMTCWGVTLPLSECFSGLLLLFSLTVLQNLSPYCSMFHSWQIKSWGKNYSAESSLHSLDNTAIFFLQNLLCVFFFNCPLMSRRLRSFVDVVPFLSVFCWNFCNAAAGADPAWPSRC